MNARSEPGRNASRGAPAWETALRERIRSEEARYGGTGKPADSLWSHVERVALLARRLGREEGLDPDLCRMGGLFHDAGKFAGGQYHGDEEPEEEKSVAVLHALAADHAMDPRRVEEAAHAIRQLYVNDPDDTPLARVLFDADNLDKLGMLGVANFFIKNGLRGRGLSREVLHQFTVELTYAHCAAACMKTRAGRNLAAKRSAETRAGFERLLDALREDGLYDFRIEEERFEGLRLQVAVPAACACGGRLERRLRSEEGLKCREIHLEHRCAACGETYRLRFCQPRLNKRDMDG